MRRQHHILIGQQGMTLLEVMVTLGILSMILIGTLRLYSTTYKNLQTHNALIDTIHDANLVMSYIGDDIRQADQVLNNYSNPELDTVVAAMKMGRGISKRADELALTIAVLVATAGEDEHPACPGRVLDRPMQGRHERVGDILENQSDGRRLPIRATKVRRVDVMPPTEPDGPCGAGRRRACPPFGGVERVAGVEPARPIWKIGVLPLNNTRGCL